MFYQSSTVERRQGFIQSYAGVHVDTADFVPPIPMITYPICDGDTFDLGGRRIEVIGVPGHTFGTIVLLERDTRTLYSGDACNVNTLLCLPGSASVEEYLESLGHLKSFAGAFDLLYGGHGSSPEQVSIVDEAIELCHEILAGTDDAQLSPNRLWFYGKNKNDAFERDDGKRANIAYLRENIRKGDKAGGHVVI
jgi:glyoxylase-like metal-dependent hydrolase (beta-lactamase superfamily II)